MGLHGTSHQEQISKLKIKKLATLPLILCIYKYIKD